MTYPSSLESERRQATIVFADISGFTSMSEKLDAEEITSVMNRCFSMLGEIISRNGGIIDKFIGDCVMILFGVPAAIEDAPQRAINTSIEMRDSLYQFNNKNSFKIPLDIHIGINTGEVVAGEIGSKDKREYTVMGDSVNIASRLKDVSERGQILVGQSTYLFTKDTYDYIELPLVSLKGKEKPVASYKLQSTNVVMRKEKFEKFRIITSEMVGRQAELDKLELQVIEVINGKGSIVSIIGEAGIGKSRLVAELKEKDEIGRVILLEGRATSIGRNLGFHPIIEILKKWASIQNSDTAIVSIRKIETLIIPNRR